MEKYRIGFCPTMQPYVDKIARKVDEVEMMPFSSAGQVLSMLRNDNLDGVLIGRTAYAYEIDSNTNFIRLKDGITLAFKMKYAVSEEQLKQVDVLTYLPPEKVEHVEKFFHQIYYRDTLEQCLEENLEVPVIVDWNDFKDDFELLIPVNNYGKTQEFRAPVIYHKNIEDNVLEKIKSLL